MTTATITATVGSAIPLPEGINLTLGSANQDTTALAAAIATAVADGASPTQAHVTAINTAYTAFAASLGADATLSINPSTVSTKFNAKRILAFFAKAIDSGYGSLS